MKTKTTILLQLLTTAIFLFTTLNIFAQEAGFFLDDWVEKTAAIPSWEMNEKSNSDPTLTITVDFNQKLRKVPKYVYGNNAVSWDNSIRSNATAMQDLVNLKPNVLRFPGGSLSNSYFWNLNNNEIPADIPVDFGNTWEGMNTPNWQMGVDDYYEFLEETNSIGQICVNYSYARYGTGPDPVANAAHMAAEWVRYDNGRSKFWEIGNENFGNWEEGNEIDTDLNQDGQPQFISGQLYGQHCRVFIDSMRAAAAETGADIKIGIVVYDAETSWDPISEVWNEGLMPEAGDIADFLAVHNYYTPYNENSSVSTILNSYTRTKEFMDVLKSDMMQSGKAMLPVAMTEWNIFAVGSMQQVSYINGIHAALLLGEFIKNGYGMANRWDLVNGWNNGDDHAIFSSGGEPGVDPYNPRPAFFYMYYFQEYFGDNMLQSSHTGNSNIVSYASSFSSGETGMVIVNKGTSHETAIIDISNFNAGTRYYCMTLTGGSDNGDFSRKVLLNGIQTDEEGGGPDNYMDIKAKAFPVYGGIKVELPPLSVVYLLVDKEEAPEYISSSIDTNPGVISMLLSTRMSENMNPGDFSVKVNGSDNPVLSVTRDNDNPNRINISLSTPVMMGDEILLSCTGVSVLSEDGVPLVAFTDQIVDNRLTGILNNITFITRNAESGETIENCQVYFNYEEAYTNSAGEVYFEANTGTFFLDAYKQHFKAIGNKEYYIHSDTIIEILLDSAEYRVSICIKDGGDGKELKDVIVSTGIITEQSGTDGCVEILLRTGNYKFHFERPYYYSLDSSLSIESDTSFSIDLERSHADLKLRVKTGIQPVNNVMAILDNDTLYSNQLGICSFKMVPVETELSYSLEKALFYPVSGNLRINRDTTIDVSMEKSVANVWFTIGTNYNPALNAFVVIDTDTSWCDSQGKTAFLNLEKEISYNYLVGSDNFPDFSGSFYLENDTSLNLILDVGFDDMVPETDVHIYPNPATDHLTIDAGARKMRSVSVLSTSGMLFIEKRLPAGTGKLGLDLRLKPGVYFIRIEFKDRIITRKLIID